MQASCIYSCLGDVNVEVHLSAGLLAAPRREHAKGIIKTNAMYALLLACADRRRLVFSPLKWSK
jgi:hypothetical protein